MSYHYCHLCACVRMHVCVLYREWVSVHVFVRVYVCVCVLTRVCVHTQAHAKGTPTVARRQSEVASPGQGLASTPTQDLGWNRRRRRSRSDDAAACVQANAATSDTHTRTRVLTCAPTHHRLTSAGWSHRIATEYLCVMARASHWSRPMREKFTRIWVWRGFICVAKRGCASWTLPAAVAAQPSCTRCMART